MHGFVALVLANKVNNFKFVFNFEFLLLGRTATAQNYNEETKFTLINKFETNYDGCRTIDLQKENNVRQNEKSDLEKESNALADERDAKDDGLLVGTIKELEVIMSLPKRPTSEMVLNNAMAPVLVQSET